MSAKDRLQNLQAALEQRGVRDVKFFFTSYGGGLDKLAQDVLGVLDAVISGRAEPLPKLGDTVRSS